MANDIEKIEYEGSVLLPAGLKPYNNQEYPLLDAHYVWVKDDDSETLGIRLDDKIKTIGSSIDIEKDIKPLEEKIAQNTDQINKNANDILRNTVNIGNLGTKITDLEVLIDSYNFNELGKDHRVFYNEENQLLYLYIAKDDLEENNWEAVELAIEEGRVLSETTIKGGAGGGDIDTAKVILTPISPQKQDIVFGESVEIQFDFSNQRDDGTIDMIGGYLNITNNNVFIERKSISPGLITVDLTNYLKVGRNDIQIVVTNTDKRSSRLTWVINVVDLKITSSFDSSIKYKANEYVNINYTIFGNISKDIYLKVDDEILEPQRGILGSNISGSIAIPPQPHGDHKIRLWTTAEIEPGKIISSKILFFDAMFVDKDNDTPIITCDYDGSELEQYSTHVFNYFVYTPNNDLSNITISVNGEQVVDAVVDQSMQQWSYKPMTTDDVTIQFKTGDIVKEFVIKIKKFPFDISPVQGVNFDFLPVGKTNEDIENRDKYEYNGYHMTVSENFDWYNGGWRTDKDKNPYLLIKSGDRVYFDYPLFETDTVSFGKNFKFIFKTQNCESFKAEIISCYSENNISNDDNFISTTAVGIKVESQHAYMHYGTSSIDTPYAEDELVELEFNIEPSSLNSEIIIYQASDPSRIKIYDSQSIFKLSNVNTNDANKVITIGSDECDVMLYRFKAYERSLTMDETLQNYFADSLNADIMSERYKRNDFMDENTGTIIDIDKLLKLHPDLRVLLIKCPYFTKGKSNTVPGCEVTHRMGNELREHNWICKNVSIKGQGTSSNAYGTSARNLDLNFKKSEFISIEDNEPIILEKELDDEGNPTETYKPVKKYAMTENSIPVNYFNIKVNVASSENANNAVLADDYNNYQPYRRPARIYDKRIRDCMEFHPCVIFVQETDPTQANQFPVDGEYHFYACGDMGNSKKNSEAMGMLLETPGLENTPNADLECIIEISENTHYQNRFKVAPSGTAYPGGIHPIEYGSDGTILANSFWDGKVMEFRYPDTDDLLDNTTTGKVYSNAKDEIKQEIINTLLISEEEAEKLLEQPEWQNKILAKKDAQIQINRKRIETMVKNFTNMWNWVESTDTTAVTNDRLNPPVTYGNKTYNIDNEEYRIAKFLAEYQQYFVRNSLLYHYLFTERHTMVDNRAKNTFLHYNVNGDEIGKWDYVFNYDNDTADGNDNSGGLTFTYGMEDIDKLPNGDTIFNARDSVLWVNVRNILGQDLETLAKSTITIGGESIDISSAWDAGRIIKKFNEYQWYKPERLEQMDMWRKYIRPYEGYDVPNPPDNMSNPIKGDYLNMMYGRKTLQRLQYEVYQGPYIGTKYTLGSVTNNMMVVRARTASFINNYPDNLLPKGITLTPFSDMYATVDYDNTYVKKRAKAGEPILIEAPSGLESLNDKNIQFPVPSLLSDLGDLSGFYIKQNKFEGGRRLLELKIGSDIPGYKNPGMFQLSLIDNVLLLKLDLRQIEFITGAENVDVSKCINLKEIYTTGSNVNSIVFANGGLIEIAEINAVSSLVMRNLIYLKTFKIPSYNFLTRLVYENCSDAVNLAMLLQDAENLNAIRLLDIDLRFANTSVLNRLTKINGIGNNNSDVLINQPVITGKVHVNIIRQAEIETYTKLWPDLKVTYDKIQPQGIVIFQNEDGTELYRTFVDYGSTIPDPVALGYIPTPIKEPTAQYSFTYNGWDRSLSIGPSELEQIITITATYAENLREYTINWYNDEEKISTKKIIDTQKIYYGNEAVYKGEIGIPQKEDASSGSISYLFNGWDKSTGYIIGDMNVYPKWQEGSLFPTGGNTSSVIPAQLKNFVNKNFDTSTMEQYFGPESTVPFDFGYMPSFDNIDDEELVKKGSPIILTGSNNYNTKIKLLSEDKSWVLAIDVTFEYKNGNSYMLSCGNQNRPNGLRLSYGTGSVPTIYWGSNSSGVSLPRIPKNITKTTGLGQTTYKHAPREILVLRHIKGDNNLYIYINNRESLNAPALTLKDTAIASDLDFDLIFGSDYNGSNNAIGKINYAKLWWDDLGDTECKKIASWIYETIQVNFVGFHRYGLSNSEKTCTASFTMSNKVLDVLYRPYNASYTGGFKYSAMRTYFTNKILKGVSPLWQQILADVDIFNLKGGQSDGAIIEGTTPDGQSMTQDDYRAGRESILISSNKLYAPCKYELDATNNSDVYSAEVLPDMRNPDTAKYPCLSTSAQRVATSPTREGLAYPWFTRSISPSQYNYNWAVDIDGKLTTGDLGVTNTSVDVFYNDLGITNWSSGSGNLGIILSFSI